MQERILLWIDLQSRVTFSEQCFAEVMPVALVDIKSNMFDPLRVRHGEAFTCDSAIKRRNNILDLSMLEQLDCAGHSNIISALERLLSLMTEFEAYGAKKGAILSTGRSSSHWSV